MVGERELSPEIAGVGGPSEARAAEVGPARRASAGEPSGNGEARGRPPARGNDGPARADAARWLERLAPRRETLPPGVECTVHDESARWYRVRLGLLPLQATLEIEIWHGEAWAHLALTGRIEPPSLAELDWCRDLFFGDRKTVQILPRKRDAFVAGLRSVHLYAQLEADTLPSNREQG